MILDEKVIHIAGSASERTEPSLIQYGHDLIRGLVNSLLRRGVRFLIQIGKEDYKRIDGTEIPIIFDWTVLSETYNYILLNRLDFTSTTKKPIITLVKQDFLESLPARRRVLWDSMVSAGAIQLEFMAEGWSSGAVRRIRMAELGDLLIILSGGEGAEHLAQQYNQLYKPIIPLDLNLGSSKGDGSGGGAKLFSRMLLRHDPFLNLSIPALAGELFLSIKTENGKNSVERVTKGILRLIENITPPIAFYVRMLAKDETDYNDVENYFRKVVDPIILKKGYSIKEMGTQVSSSPWINVEIFESLHKASVVVADLTGLRLNCLIELGYALGHSTKVILTAKKGTKLPLDTAMYECLFWDPMDKNEVKISSFQYYLERNLNRPPIIRNRDAL